MIRRLRILLITITCDGTDVGEAWSSFQWASRLAQHHDVTVLTGRSRGKPLAAPQLPGARVVEWPIRFDRFGRLSSMLKPGYVPFYFQARRWIKKAFRRGERFDLIHQLSPLAMRYPSPGAGLGIPLVIGPWGGSLDTPVPFAAECGSAPSYTRLRNIDAWRLRHDPMLRRTYTSANLVLGVAPYVQELLTGGPCRRFETMSETGVVSLPELSERPASETARILFVGRLTRTKGARDAIRALARLTDVPGWTFDLLGEGEDRAACETEAQNLGLQDRITFHGKVSRDVVSDFYRRTDLFLFPSFREPSGNAVLEAMSYGLPSIVADRGGPGYAVSNDCGIRVPVTSPVQFADDLSQALRIALSDSARRRRMGIAARDRIRESFLWDRKVQQLSEWYEQLVAAAPQSEAPSPPLANPAPLSQIGSA